MKIRPLCLISGGAGAGGDFSHLSPSSGSDLGRIWKDLGKICEESGKDLGGIWEGSGWVPFLTYLHTYFLTYLLTYLLTYSLTGGADQAGVV